MAVLVMGPLLGMFIGMIAGALSLAPGYVDGGRAPGDGFLIIGYMLGGLFVSLAPSLGLAGLIILRADASSGGRGILRRVFSKSQ
jgi:hypothetical protein